MSTINFRVATHADAELVSALSIRTFHDTFHADNSQEDMELFLLKSFSVEAVKQELLDSDNTVFLAYVNGVVGGYIKLTNSKGIDALEGQDTIEISRLYVVKEKIGFGVGAALMKKGIDEATVRHKKVIWLGVWEKNSRAINFYKKWDFKKFGAHVFLVGNDPQNDWLMKKML